MESEVIKADIISDAFFIKLLETVLRVTFHVKVKNGSHNDTSFYRLYTQCNRNKGFQLTDRTSSDYGNELQSYEVLKQLRGYFTNLNSFFVDLMDKESKDLLVTLVIHRLLDGVGVSLPTDNPEYWQKKQYLQSLKVNEPGLSGFFDTARASLYDLSVLGYSIRLYQNLERIIQVFVLKQCQYNRWIPIIRAEFGDCILDVGGGWGETALYFANEVGHRGKVYVFETGAQNLKIIDANLALNPSLRERIEVISKVPGKIANGPISGLDAQLNNNISIDEFVNQNNITTIDFIRIDTGGTELEVLSRAGKSLQRFRPKLAVTLNYYNINDLGTIYQYIKSLNLGYYFYLGHFSIDTNGTFLFASIQNPPEKDYLDFVEPGEIGDQQWERLTNEVQNEIDVKMEYLNCMRLQLAKIKTIYRNKKADYILWGASNSGMKTMEVLSKFLPNLSLVGFIDKFKKGYIYERPIYSPDQLDMINFDFIIIATTPGKHEAEDILRRKGFIRSRDFFYGYGVVE